MFAAEFEPAHLDRRRSPRAPVSLDAQLGQGGLGRALCKVVDLSVGGARLQTYSALRRDTTIWLTLPGIGPRAADIMWADDYSAGCRFRESLTPEQLAPLLGE